MPSNCDFDSLDILGFTVKIVCNSFLWIVTGICLYFMAMDENFKKRVPNIIVTNLLLSDSLSALLGSVYREYLFQCDIKPYIECTMVIFFTRTFGYVSMAFLILLTIERYVKFTQSSYTYNVLFSKNRLRIAIFGIWVGFIIFSIFTTPYWIYLLIPKIRDSSVPVCVYSNVMEPLTAFITIFLSQFMSMIILVCINVVLVVKIKRAINKAAARLEVTQEQVYLNARIIKKVEFNVFVISFVLTCMNLIIFGFSIIDLIELSNGLKISIIEIPHVTFKVFEFFVTVYPFGESMICFVMNADIVSLMRRKIHRILQDFQI